MQSSIDLERLRDNVRNYIDSYQYESALFWADKVCSLSAGAVADLYLYAQTLYLTKQYHRAAHLLTSKQLEKSHADCRYLVAKCYYECKDYQEALNTLEQADSNSTKTPGKGKHKDIEQKDDAVTLKNSQSSIHLLRGKIYEAMENRGLATECFREALKLDVFCFEAFELLINHQMLSAHEEKDLIESLPFSKQCQDNEIELLRFLYENRLKKYNKPNEFAVPSSLATLDNNMDILVNIAERHYYNCAFTECFRTTSLVLEQDLHNSQCLPLHVAVLVELKKTNTLFYLAHKLVDLYPNKPIAWFAVGCYYLLIGKNEPARRYFSKATTLDRVYGPAWLAFGHSFAAENEHDQAMAAYFTASQLMKGCHLPLLYIGLEYGLTNNVKLAERFFTQAESIAPEDPFVLHEMGVIAFQNQDWESAEGYFKDAIVKIQSISEDSVTEKWEPLLNNMGHTCRKLQKYEEGLDFHQKALVLFPKNPSTYSAIGFIHSLMGNTDTAVDYFHKALGLRRDDTFSTTMLGLVVEDLMHNMTPCDGIPDVIPEFSYGGKLNSSLLTETELQDNSQVSIAIDTSSALVPIDESMIADSSNVSIEVDMEGNG